jgi:hypothetical protein
MGNTPPDVEVAEGVLLGKPAKTGVAVAVWLGVRDGVAVWLGVRLALGVKDGVKVKLAVGVRVWLGVGLAVAVNVWLAVGVALGSCNTAGRVGGGKGLNGTEGLAAINKLPPKMATLPNTIRKVMRS